MPVAKHFGASEAVMNPADPTGLGFCYRLSFVNWRCPQEGWNSWNHARCIMLLLLDFGV